MNRQSIARATLPLLAAASLLLGACATGPQSGQQSTTDTTNALQGEAWDGDGMDIPIDGSSMEAFEASCARIKAHTTPAQYESFQQALEWHRTYDLAAREKMELLVPRLDGKTPNDLLKAVRWRKPDSGSSPAKKDAADAKIIDT